MRTRGVKVNDILLTDGENKSEEAQVRIRTMSEGKYAAWRAEREEIEREWREACMFGYDTAFTSRGECLVWDNGKGKWAWRYLGDKIRMARK